MYNSSQEIWGIVRSTLAQKPSSGFHKKDLALLQQKILQAPQEQQDTLRAYIRTHLGVYFLEPKTQAAYLSNPGIYNCIPLRERLLNTGFADWVYGGPNVTPLLATLELPPYGAIITSTEDRPLSDYQAKDFLWVRGQWFRGPWYERVAHSHDPETPLISPKVTILSTIVYGGSQALRSILDKLPAFPLDTHFFHVAVSTERTLWDRDLQVFILTYRPPHTLNTYSWTLETAQAHWPSRSNTLGEVRIRGGGDGPLIQGLLDNLFPFLSSHYRSVGVQFRMWIHQREKALAFLESLEHA